MRVPRARFARLLTSRVSWLIGGPVLVLMAALFIIQSQMSSVYEAVYQDYAQSNSYANARQEYWHKKCFAHTTVEEVARCFDSAINSAREPARSEEDLKAQKQMAIWSAWMVYVTFGIGVFSIIVAVIGVGLIKRTLDLQLVATGDATKASRAATKSANAAIKANILSRKAFIANQRPWMSFEGVKVIAPLQLGANEGQIKCELRFKNVGRTPAKEVRIATLVSSNILRVPPQTLYASVVQDLALKTWTTVIFPGKEICRTFHIKINYADFIVDGRGRRCAFMPILAACASYGNIYGEERFQTGFVYTLERVAEGTDRIGPDEDIPAEQIHFVEWSGQGLIVT